MVTNLLLVGEQQIDVASLRRGIELNCDDVAVSTAVDGLTAIEALRTRPIDVVVTSYRLQGMDGLALARKINTGYPDIPVFLVTGHGDEGDGLVAQSIGVAGYLQKSFLSDSLFRLLSKTLQEQTEGGVMHKVNTTTFLQLVQMEQLACTIRIRERAKGKRGILFFRDGDLTDARYLHHRGEKAAVEVLSWDEVGLKIQHTCLSEVNRIEKGLQAVLMDAALYRDEKNGKEAEHTVEIASPEEELPVLPDLLGADEAVAPISMPTMPSGNNNNHPQPEDTLLDGLIGQTGVIKVIQDSSRKALLSVFQELGRQLGSGELQVAYIAEKKGGGNILLPDRDYSVVVVNDKCHRDDLMHLLADSYERLQSPGFFVRDV